MRTFRRWRCLLLLVGACFCAAPAAAQVLVSEVYYKNLEIPGFNSHFDHSYVELLNAGTGPVDLSGWGLRYWGKTDPGVVVPLTGVMPAGGRYLVAFGAAHPVPILHIPAPDASSPVEIVSDRSFAVLNASAAPQDTVGIGGDPPAFETRPRYTWNGEAVLRLRNGCFDSNDGYWDLTGGFGDPQNSASPAVPCVPPPPCTYSLSATDVTLQAQSPAYALQLTTFEHCIWTTQGPPWLTFFPTEGIGSWGITISGEIFEAGPPRTGTISVGMGSATATATVTQPPKTPCVFTFNPPTPRTVGGTGGVETVMVETAAHCQINAVSSVDWIMPVSPVALGSGQVAFMVSHLPSGNRTGTITVGSAVLTITQYVGPNVDPDPTDEDHDGLMDAWERRFGLSPTIATGTNGPLGDPDADGLTNLQEQQLGTHPLGYYRRYFAEGVANQFFQTTIALFSPDQQPSTVVLRYMTESGEAISEVVDLPSRTRRTITPGALSGIAGKSFSTTIESNGRVVADRTVVWGDGYGAHAETGLQSPATQWFLAEGSTSGDFSLFYLLQNPSANPVTATIRFLLPAGQPPVEKAYVLAPASRLTIPVNTVDPRLEHTDVSAAVQASAPIIVERAMYLSKPGRPFLAGHESAGIINLSTEWFLAEGATGDFFDCFILIANPGAQNATLTIDYLLSTGQTYQKTYTIAPESRTTIWVDDEQLPAGSGTRPLANAAVSARVVASRPVAVERTMWWPGPGLTQDFWYESHNSPGTTVATWAWALAEGIVGTAANWDTYVLIANTSATAATVVITAHRESGQSTQRTFVIAPRSRLTVSMRDGFGLADQRFATLVESSAGGSELVVERAMYSTAGGVLWSAGTNALATPMP